jgi:hypothetical protein
MRLLQLVTGLGELVDLHPHVTVVSGLDAYGRRRLVDAVIGLAAGRADDQRGLLEAHGVLFDLAPGELDLLDIEADDVQPVVTANDLPALRHAAPTAERASAEHALAVIEARWEAARERDAIAQAAVVAAAEAVDRARAATEGLDARPASLPTHEELAAHLQELGTRHRQLADDLAGRIAELEEAAAVRADVESSTAEVRDRRQDAAMRCSAVAARLEAARMATDPEAGAAAAAAAASLAQVEAEAEAERETERLAEQRDADEPPAVRLARIGSEIDALEKRLAANGPADIDRVADQLAPLRRLDAGVLAPMPEAIALADELAVLEVELRSADARSGRRVGGRMEARARLDAANEALLEAEQAVRSPELDRDLVQRLELVHADLLEAIEKAEGRFAGARAQRRVEAHRAEENAILDELGLTSYSDFLMGSSLLHIDHDKEAALDAARAELSAAEDAWRALDEETDAELARAQQMERRRALLEEARGLLGHPVASDAAIDELRALRIEVEPSPEITAGLRQALDDAGVALGDEDLERGDLVLVAETWLTEAGEAGQREVAMRAELGRLRGELAEVMAALEVAEAAGGRSREEDRAERVAAARARCEAAEERHRAHLEAEEEVTTLVEELATAAEVERIAAEAAVGADAELAAAVEREAEASANRERVEAELAVVVQEEAELAEVLRAQEDHVGEEPEVLKAALAFAEGTHAQAVEAAVGTASVLSGLAAERHRAKQDLAVLQDGAAPVEVTHLAEEVEWYLLARLAAQRSVSLGGSLPLVLDDALSGLSPEDVEHVLGRLERMSEAVQVVVISDDPVIASWATRAGADRAAVVRPQPVSIV